MLAGKRKSTDPLDTLLDGETEDPGAPKGIAGARGAAAQEQYRRHFESPPGLYSRMVDANMAKHRRVNMDVADPRFDSAREFVADYMPLGHDPTLGRLVYGIAIARDQMQAGKTAEGIDTLSRLLVASEQAALDPGPWAKRWEDMRDQGVQQLMCRFGSI